MYELVCANKETPIKQIGQMDVEVYFVDGDTDEEKLVRNHKIDVHRVQQIKGYKGSTYAGVNEYFIQRYAEAPVGIIHTSAGNYQSKTPYPNPSTSETPGRLVIYMPYSPQKATYYRTYVRCSVNGTRIKIDRDSAQLDSSGRGEFVSSALLSRNDPKYAERITFTYLKAKLPITLSPGKWECSFVEAGEVYRTFRFAVGSDNKIVLHPEQKNGNINLFTNTYLVNVEIPAGGAKIDGRSMPMPDAGIFYGIPWSTPEGKAAAAKVPKKGKPYPVMPK